MERNKCFGSQLYLCKIEKEQQKTKKEDEGDNWSSYAKVFFSPEGASFAFLFFFLFLFNLSFSHLSCTQPFNLVYKHPQESQNFMYCCPL